MKKIIKACIIILLLGGLCFLGYYKYQEYQYHQSPEYKLLQKGYTEKQVQIILDKGTEKQIETIIDQDYNSQIPQLMNHKDFKRNRFQRYLNYQGPKSIDDLILLVNQDIDQTSIPYSDDLLNFVKTPYFIKYNLSRYLDYKNKYTDLSYPEIIKRVNSGIDVDFYTNIKKTDTSKGNLVLINKYYQLDASYTPNDLQAIDDDNHYLSKEAALHFSQMIHEAYKAGYNYKVNSAYRSYQDQEEIYQEYKNNYGYTYAENYAARPGHSEHQSGLAVDIVAQDPMGRSFDQTEEYAWLQEHAHEYGFIMRYTKENEYITGYHYEPWHYRYVGVEAAQKMKQEGLTFEEYYHYYIETGQ